MAIVDSRAGDGIHGCGVETMLVKLGALELLFTDTCKKIKNVKYVFERA